MSLIHVSKRRTYSGPLPSFYVGRPSPLGNPFLITDNGLDACLDMYRDHLSKNLNRPDIKNHLDLIRSAAAKSDIVLLCWCRCDFSKSTNKPRCHADIVKEFL